MTVIKHNNHNYEYFKYQYFGWAKKKLLYATRSIRHSKIDGITLSEIKNEFIMKTLNENLYITQPNLTNKIEDFFRGEYDVAFLRFTIPSVKLYKLGLRSSKYRLKRTKYIVVYYLKEKTEKAKKELQKMEDSNVIENPKIKQIKDNIKNSKERIKNLLVTLCVE